MHSSPAHLQAPLQAELAVLVLELIDEQHLMHLQAQWSLGLAEPAKRGVWGGLHAWPWAACFSNMGTCVRTSWAWYSPSSCSHFR